MYLSREHKEEYERLLQMDKTNEGDTERKALFYILAGNKDLRTKGASCFYDFNNHVIKRDAAELDYTSGSRALIDLAFNLYNEHPQGNHRSTLDLFSKLDSNNFFLAINALKIRLPHAANQVSHIFY